MNVFSKLLQGELNKTATRFAAKQTVILKQELNVAINNFKQVLYDIQRDSRPKLDSLVHKGKMEAFSPGNGALIWETLTAMENAIKGNNLKASLDLSRVLTRVLVGTEATQLLIGAIDTTQALTTTSQQISLLRLLGEFIFSICRQTTGSVVAKHIHLEGLRHGILEGIEPAFDDNLATNGKIKGYEEIEKYKKEISKHFKKCESELRKICFDNKIIIAPLRQHHQDYYSKVISDQVPGGIELPSMLDVSPASDTSILRLLKTEIATSDAMNTSSKFKRLLNTSSKFERFLEESYGVGPLD